MTPLSSSSRPPRRSPCSPPPEDRPPWLLVVPPPPPTRGRPSPRFFRGFSPRGVDAFSPTVMLCSAQHHSRGECIAGWGWQADEHSPRFQYFAWQPPRREVAQRHAKCRPNINLNSAPRVRESRSPTRNVRFRASSSATGDYSFPRRKPRPTSSSSSSPTRLSSLLVPRGEEDLPRRTWQTCPRRSRSRKLAICPRTSVRGLLERTPSARPQRDSAQLAHCRVGDEQTPLCFQEARATRSRPAPRAARATPSTAFCGRRGFCRRPENFHQKRPRNYQNAIRRMRATALLLEPKILRIDSRYSEPLCSEEEGVVCAN